MIDAAMVPEEDVCLDDEDLAALVDGKKHGQETRSDFDEWYR